MSSAGWWAAQRRAAAAREQPPDPSRLEHAEIRGTRQTGRIKPWVKLLNPQPRVTRTLEMSGMNVFFDIFADETAALASF